MRITTFFFCILGTLVGVWMADLGAWPSAGGIWVICIILAIDGAASAVIKSSALDKERARTLSTPSLGRSTVSTRIVAEGGGGAGGPPQKKPKNPFKIGDKALAFGKHEGTIISIAGQSVKIISDDNKVVWVPSRECELI